MHDRLRPECGQTVPTFGTRIHSGREALLLSAGRLAAFDASCMRTLMSIHAPSGNLSGSGNQIG
jgi:hypothetical protein